MDSVGLIQMTSGPNPSENLRFLAQEIVKCKAHGAKWVVCPENALVFGSKQDYHLLVYFFYPYLNSFKDSKCTAKNRFFGSYIH